MSSSKNIQENSWEVSRDGLRKVYKSLLIILECMALTYLIYRLIASLQTRPKPMSSALERDSLSISMNKWVNMIGFQMRKLMLFQMNLILISQASFKSIWLRITLKRKFIFIIWQHSIDLNKYLLTLDLKCSHLRNLLFNKLWLQLMSKGMDIFRKSNSLKHFRKLRYILIEISWSFYLILYQRNIILGKMLDLLAIMKIKYCLLLTSSISYSVILKLLS